MNKLVENTLEPSFATRQCFPERKQKSKAPVTIAIGLICNNAIVMASDSQTTDMATGQFRRDVEKSTS
jgi:20S proteasome alpha/beta subunit